MTGETVHSQSQSKLQFTAVECFHSQFLATTKFPIRKRRTSDSFRRNKALRITQCASVQVFLRTFVNSRELLYHFAVDIASKVYPDAESSTTELCGSPRERASDSALIKSTPLSNIGLPRFVSGFSINGPPEEESDHSTCKKSPCEEDFFSVATCLSSVHGENDVPKTSSSINSKYHQASVSQSTDG